MSAARTMFEKIWSRHVVADGPGGQTLLYIDRHLLHEGSTHAFARLARSGRRPRRPEAMFATADHYVPTANRSAPIPDPEIRAMVADLERGTRESRHRVPRPRRPAAGHRARDRPRAGLDAAGHHAGLRRLAHLDARRSRRARVRHRVVRSRARDGDAVPLAEEAAGHARQRHGRATRGRRRQGRHPDRHRQDRRRRRERPRHRVRGKRDRRHVHGRAHDRLQHVDRGGRAGRHGGARRDDLCVSARSAPRAAGRPLGSRARALEDAALGSRRRLRPRGDHRGR